MQGKREEEKKRLDAQPQSLTSDHDRTLHAGLHTVPSIC